MTKTVKNVREAWELVNEIFPGDYSKDESSSSRAGYPIYRGSNRYDYVCDLGDRLEVNFSDGHTENIWIVPEEPKTECNGESFDWDFRIESEAIPEAIPEASEEMIETLLTVGLFDKDTEKQEISTIAAKRFISEILINDFEIFAFTMIDCSGVYKMQSTGRIVYEPSIRVEIASDVELKTGEIIAALKRALNQESIMFKVSRQQISFK